MSSAAQHRMGAIILR